MIASLATVQPWFSGEAAGWIGGGMGSFIGVVYGGLLGGLGGLLAQHGKGRAFVFGGFDGAFVVSAISLVVGLTALLLGQPYHVWYPFLLLGAICIFVMPFARMGVGRAYAVAEQRRLDAKLISGSARPHQRQTAGATGESAFSRGGEHTDLILRLTTAALTIAVTFACGFILYRLAGTPSGDEQTVIADRSISQVNNALVSAVTEDAGRQDEAMPPASASTTFTLSNGVNVHVLPVPGLAWVGVIAAYEVGMVDDPAGRAQMAHLVEHLRITAAAGDLGVLERMNELNTIGSVNGETLPSMTYYDYLVPTEHLQQVLEAEASRLDALHITQADITREGPRAANEAIQLAHQAEPFLHKFATMAALQGWKHGQTHVNVASGLEKIPAVEAIEFCRHHYRPDNLTLIVTGDLTVDSVRTQIKQTIGRIELDDGDQPDGVGHHDAMSVRRTENAADHAHDAWPVGGSTHRMTWDLPRSVVAVGYRPSRLPDDADHTTEFARSMVMSVMPAFLQREAQVHGESETLHRVLGTSLQWPASDVLPVMALAVVREGQASDAAASDLMSYLDTFADRGLTQDFVFALRQGNLIPPNGAPTPQMLDMLTAQLMQSRSINEQRARGMIVLQHALNQWAVMHAADADTASEIDDLRSSLAELDDEAWRSLLREALDPDRRFVLIIEPSLADEAAN